MASGPGLWHRLHVSGRNYPMIVGAHVMIQSSNDAADKAFFSDVLGFCSVDAGGGFLIFAVPPSEIAVHEGGTDERHELFLMCDDVDDFIDEMKTRNIACTPAQNRGWGILTQLTLPGGGKLGVYQPLHKRPKAKTARSHGAKRETRRGRTLSSTKRRPAAKRATRPRAKARKR
jgi:hypothetical protein